MAELSLLQEYGIFAGVGGFLLSVVNAFQKWMKNRPILTVLPGDHPADRDINVTIENPGTRAITIGRSWCLPGVHELRPFDRNLRQTIRAADGEGINWVIPSKTTGRFSLVHASLLLCSWHSNSAFLFSRVPLFLFISKHKRERMRHAGGAPEA